MPFPAAHYEIRRVGTAADTPVLRLDGTIVEVVEVWHNDRDRQGDGKHPGDSAHRPDQLTERADRQHVAVPDCRHRDHGPPERVRDGVELRLVVVAGLGEVDGTREQHDADEQKEDEQSELSHAGADRLTENLQSFRVPRQLEYAENADEPDNPQNGERHGTVSDGPTVVGDSRAEREEVWGDGDDVDDVHEVTEERHVVGRRREPDQEFDGKPDDAGSLDDEERFGEQRHVVVVFQWIARKVVRRRVAAGRYLGVIGRRLADTKTPKAWQRLQTEDDDRDEYNNDWC